MIVWWWWCREAAEAGGRAAESVRWGRHVKRRVKIWASSGGGEGCGGTDRDGNWVLGDNSAGFWQFNSLQPELIKQID